MNYLHAVSMSNKYTILLKIISSIFMMLALVWLTITPYIYKVQQQKNFVTKSQNTKIPATGDEENVSSPFGNTSEEETSNSLSTISEEYLHSSQSFEHYITGPSSYYTTENVKIYIAFHGELLSPPPES
jgi:hypothetical protein